MPEYKAPIADIRFVLEEYLEVSRYAALQGFDGLDADDIAALLEGAARICEGVAQPLNRVGDEVGCRFRDGEVTTPPGFREAYRAFAEGGWIGLALDSRYGGKGLPGVLSEAVYEVLSGANMAFSGYIELSEAVFTAIHAAGSEEQKRLYLGKLSGGEWTGAMHLTEPQAGSDLRLVRTRAEPQADGTYRITGSKTFITNAEHDLAPNIVNLVLARISGAPDGGGGLSLFIVPKYLPDENDEPGERNAVRCLSIEHKMGLRAAPTGVIAYDGATGFLVGEPNRGLAAMFVMVNDARLGVALQGLSIAEAAYQNAAAYAKERLQGRPVAGVPGGNRDAVPIVDHPDVRRMLLVMRSFTEGARALGLWVALQIDLSKRAADPAERARADRLVALLTPVIKAHFTDGGFEVADLAIQCFGGYGYIRETGIEQFLRDVRITRIYEGTNGIQALDLVRRKLTLDDGAALAEFLALVADDIAAARAIPALESEAAAVARALSDAQEAADWMRGRLPEGLLDPAGGATDFLRLFGLLAMGWTWLRVLVITERRSARRPEGDRTMRAKQMTGRFYILRMLPETDMLKRRATMGAADLMALAAEDF
ncbi:acyl-CoA dehydrogenase [Oceanibacterium hippocampi]|uniref:Acyl-CoA dehydrogenase n=1 Tax=Oceanibacterium hippocampi TaxID=745714 RepID=A0A1Y5U0E7_9PROT|nr:acyl-CoA dehydrogenase [Oceanibacterium hippocampi]SLN75488.1 Acyl-CoA dehydrogenase [Oceanibacterium hippocampi]